MDTEESAIVFKIAEKNSVFIPNIQAFKHYYAGVINLNKSTAMVYEFFDAYGHVIGAAITNVLEEVNFSDLYKTPQMMISESGLRWCCLEETVISLYYSRAVSEEHISQDIRAIEKQGFRKIHQYENMIPMCYINSKGVLKVEEMFEIHKMPGMYLTESQDMILKEDTVQSDHEKEAIISAIADGTSNEVVDQLR